MRNVSRGVSWDDAPISGFPWHSPLNCFAMVNTHASKPLKDKCFRDSCPQLDPAASFAWFYNLIVLLYLFLQLLRRHGGATLFRSMADQLCWRQNFWTTRQKWPKNDLNWGVGSSYGTNKPPLPNPLFPYETLKLAMSYKLATSFEHMSFQQSY
jgi:hypothetical protein